MQFVVMKRNSKYFLGVKPITSQGPLDVLTEEHSINLVRMDKPSVEESHLILGKFEGAARGDREQAASTLVTTLTEIVKKKQTVDETMALLLRETRVVRSRRRRKMTFRLITGSGLLLMIILLHPHVLNWFWILQLSGGAWMVDRAANIRMDATRTLAQAEDPRAVGVLAIALRYGDAPVQRLAEAALLKLLPRVKASDGGYVDAEQMAALLSIADGDEANLKVALLRALEQIGDSRAIPTVENMLKDDWKIVRSQAEECLPYLRERARRARESATLLRASNSVGGTSSAHLLRPASDLARTAQADELLRPS